MFISGFDISGDQKELEERHMEILCPEVGRIELAEVIDAQAVQSLMDDFFELVHIPMGLDDLNGKTLVSVGWQDICTKFHRVHPETCKYCFESNKILSSGISPGKFKKYKCLNNMWDIATPIIVNDQHIGNIVAGQFFFEDEPLNYEFFRSKARKYGFNEQEYIEALDKVPRLSRENVDIGMSFFRAFANMISQLSYSNIMLSKSLSVRDELVAALELSESKYRQIIETSREGIWILDTNNRTIFVNQKVSDMLGYSIDEILGQSPQKFLAPKYREIVTKRLIEHIQKANSSIDYQFIRKDGSDLWCILSTSPLFDDEERYAGSLGMLTDITVRKKVEKTLKETLDSLDSKVKERTLELETAYKSLKESEASLAEAQKMAHIGNWEWDITSNKAYWSEEMYRIFKRDPQELAPSYNEYLSCIHPDDLKYYRDALKTANYESTFSIDFRIVLVDGEERTLHLKSEFILNDTNSPIKIKGTVQDITELKKSEEKIRTLASIVESSNDAIGTISLEGFVTSWNKGGEHVYGYSLEEIVGKPISIVAPPHLSEEVKELSELVKQGKKVHNYETKRVRKDGKTVDVSVTFSPVFDMRGKLIAISFISRDISESKKAEEKLFEEKKKAEVANRAKSDFLANMSHELRTPLNSILGFSDMLHEQAYGELNEKQLRVTGNISKSGKHLQNLINNLLDISKVEAGKMELDYKNFDLATKLNMVRYLLSPISDRKNIKIEIEIDTKLTSIYADEDKFAQIMYNLVDNAIKFSFENSIVIIGARKKGEMVEISVKDTGIGIKVKDQKKLFKPFSQIDNFSSKKYQGTGLGLSLVKQIVLLHGGYVWFRSKKGEGSTFAFTIPIQNNEGISVSKIDGYAFT